MNNFFKSNQILFSTVILFLGAVWIGISAVYFEGSTNGFIPAPQVSFLAPDFSLESQDAENITLSNFRGDVVLVNFWGSWCPPCREEMPAMQKVYQEYQDQGFTILAVNAAYNEKPGQAIKFVSDHSLEFPIPLDKDGQVSRLYQVNAFPSSYFIDRNGIVQEIVIGGPMAEALLRTRIENLLGEDR
jgi:peroxiredoxin